MSRRVFPIGSKALYTTNGVVLEVFSGALMPDGRVLHHGASGPGIGLSYSFYNDDERFVPMAEAQMMLPLCRERAGKAQP